MLRIFFKHVYGACIRAYSTHCPVRTRVIFMPPSICMRVGAAQYHPGRPERITHPLPLSLSARCRGGFILPKREVVVMPNEENLIPNSERTPEERREIAQKGGIASGAARRRKRSLREAADLIFSLPVADKRQVNKLLRRYVPAEDIDNQMAMIVRTSSYRR